MTTPSGRDYVRIASDYAADVIAGRVLACKWVRLACERHEADMARSDTDEFPYVLDEARAAKACRFIENLQHYKGKWAGQRITLEPWQVFIVCTIFGWVHRETRLRRFRTAYVEIARKNGKSLFAAALMLFMVTADGEAGAECYSAATTRDQAKIVFEAAKQMARKSAALRDASGLEIGAHNLHVLRTASKCEALSAEGNSLDGLNIHFAAVDELHAHKTRAVYDVLETATGARTQSLLLLITTAGSNRAGVCYEQRTYVTKLLDRVATDDTYFGIIYTIDEGDDPHDVKTWAKANPNFGVSVFPDDMARLAKKAAEMPSALNNFLTKRLNVWVNADVAWMDMAAWDRCADATLDVADFEGESCVLGLDLASKVDVAARVQLFERDVEGPDGTSQRHYYAFGRYYLPEVRIEEAGNSQYAGWERAGRLVATEGNVIDFSVIEQELVDLGSRYQIREAAYDPWQATELAQRMQTEGLPMVEVRQTVQNMSEPMKQLEALVLAGRLHHDGDPVLAWMVSNVVAHLDAKDNIYPKKERPENKIDGVVALIMALGRAIAQAPAGPSVYETEGLTVV